MVRVSFLSSVMVAWLVCAAPAVAQTGCDFDIVATLPAAVDFDTQVQPILDANCVGCHQPGAEGHSVIGLDLRPGQSHAGLVNVPSAQDPALTLVRPFGVGTAESLLWHKVRCDSPPLGTRMPPPPLPALPYEELLVLYSWIYRGAPPGLAGTNSNVPIQQGMAGSWFDPSAPGHGFIIDVMAHGQPMLVVYWLTYSSTPPTSQAWFLASGAFSFGDTAVALDVHATSNGRFDEVLPRPEVTPIGHAQLMFHSCTDATFVYDLVQPGQSEPRRRSVALQRIAPSAHCASDPGIP